MGRRLATDVFVDGTRYLAGADEKDLAKVSTDAEAEGKKGQKLSVADRIVNPDAWIDDKDPSAPDVPEEVTPPVPEAPPAPPAPAA